MGTVTTVLTLLQTLRGRPWKIFMVTLPRPDSRGPITQEMDGLPGSISKKSDTKKSRICHITLREGHANENDSPEQLNDGLSYITLTCLP